MSLASALHVSYFNPRSLAGATSAIALMFSSQFYFNPRSLAGATSSLAADRFVRDISIHAPSRERPAVFTTVIIVVFISIHAPSRERRQSPGGGSGNGQFQSTLPRGSDQGVHHKRARPLYFNPRSLAGATKCPIKICLMLRISIHAPSRERQVAAARGKHVG